MLGADAIIPHFHWRGNSPPLAGTGVVGFQRYKKMNYQMTRTSYTHRRLYVGGTVVNRNRNGKVKGETSGSTRTAVRNRRTRGNVLPQALVRRLCF